MARIAAVLEIKGTLEEIGSFSAAKEKLDLLAAEISEMHAVSASVTHRVLANERKPRRPSVKPNERAA
jgi:hypothetical protein